MLTQTFGDMLFVPESECIAEFASPEALKRRILISTKPPKEYLEKKIEALEEVFQGNQFIMQFFWGSKYT